MSYCEICQGQGTVNMACWSEQSRGVSDTGPSEITGTSKQFPCPQCKMVPYKRVRAMKVTTGYPAEEFGRLQVPIERGLAARFGEYLYREGLIKFTTSGSSDLGEPRDKITITAHLGVVSPVDVKRSGADDEIATTARPPLSERLRQKTGVRAGAKRWQPPVDVSFPSDEATDEFDEPKDALGARFSGLELG